MVVVISTFLRDHVVNSIGNALAGINFDSGILHLRTGAAPGPNAAATGTVLVTITPPADAFGAAATGVISKSGTWEDTSADASGVAAHFRLSQSGDTHGATGTSDERFEGSIGQGSGDIDLDNTTIAAGQTVTITAFTVTMPAS